MSVYYHPWNFQKFPRPLRGNSNGETLGPVRLDGQMLKSTPSIIGVSAITGARLHPSLVTMPNLRQDAMARTTTIPWQHYGMEVFPGKDPSIMMWKDPGIRMRSHLRSAKG